MLLGGVTKQGIKPEPIRPLVLKRTHYILSLFAQMLRCAYACHPKLQATDTRE